MEASIDYILSVLEEHGVSLDKLQEVRKSYEIASEVHKNQYRQSGEPYIIHPLHVAANLLMMEVYDADCISAALLHDTIEDSEDNFSKEDVCRLINPTVAELVDGVTKMRRMNFSSKENQNLANTRKILSGLNKDVRIILIKLADRLHNMQTLEYKRPEKQVENAKETMELFIPITLAIGAYQLKNQLEDLSLQYLDPEWYQLIYDFRENIGEIEIPRLGEISDNINKILNENGVSNDIVLRNQTIHTIYKKMQNGIIPESMYDLFYLKILVDKEDDCFDTFKFVHRSYVPIQGKFKDYINSPRTNLYQSLHTAVLDSNGKQLKVKIRTNDMNKVAAWGVPALWSIEDRWTWDETQDYLRDECQFAKRLQELDDNCPDNMKFMDLINKDLLTDHVYVYTDKGMIMELPAGSTVFDFVSRIYPYLMDQMIGVVVNGREVPMDQVLENHDMVQVITKNNSNPFDFGDNSIVSKGLQKVLSKN